MRRTNVPIPQHSPSCQESPADPTPRSYFLRVSVNRNYSGKLTHEETFRVQASPARGDRYTRHRYTPAVCAATHPLLPSQVANEAPENNPPIKMEVRMKARRLPCAGNRVAP